MGLLLLLPLIINIIDYVNFLPRKVTSSVANSACNRCKVAKSSLVTPWAVADAINSFTLSKHAFKAANSYRVKARFHRNVPSGYPAMQP